MSQLYKFVIWHLVRLLRSYFLVTGHAIPNAREEEKKNDKAKVKEMRVSDGPLALVCRMQRGMQAQQAG